MKTVITVATVAILMGAPGKLCAQGVREHIAEQIQDLNLTSQEETKIADIRKEFSPKIREAAKGRMAVVKEQEMKVRAVLTPEQKTRLETLKEDRQERRSEGLAERIAHLDELDLTDAEKAKIEAIRAEYHPKIEKAMESLRGTLTEDQRKLRAEALRTGKKRHEIMESMNLTGAQKEKVEAVGAEVRTLVREELEKVREVLTDEQEAKVADLKDERKDRIRDRWAARVANFRDLNLTDAQKTTITNIRQEHRSKVHAAGNAQRAEVREKLGMIVGVLKK